MLPIVGWIAGAFGLVIVVRACLAHPLPSLRILIEAAAVAVMAVLSWRMSFTVLKHARYSLDSSFLITAALCYPSPVPVLSGACAGLAGGLLKSRSSGNGALRGPFRRWPTLLFHAGTLVLMMAAGQAVSERLRWTVYESLTFKLVSDVSILFAVLASVNLLVMMIPVVLSGEPLGSFLQRHALSVLPIEVFNIPLAALLVLTRARAGVAAMLLLMGCTLAVSFLLLRLNGARQRAREHQAETAERAAELSALDVIAREINANLDLGRVFLTIHREVAKLLDAPAFSIALYDRERSLLRYEHLVRHGEALEPCEIPLGGDPISWVVRTAAPLAVDDLTVPDAAGITDYTLGEADRDLRSLVSIPLTKPGGDVIGALTVGSPRPTAYSQRQREMLESIGLHAAIAIENARYYELATVDRGTRLYLKDYFMQRLEEELARSRRYGRPFAVFMMDLDGFKSLNDRFGHLAGDRFLQHVGRIIRSSLRSPDIAARYGGEEFAALLPETTHAEAVAIAERV
ncbi:MAG TPA: sensor domain-containing diguanylate cyclase, partial [Candidatus Polarisedimenticolia bacterium]|nr:sensor domain-containing diguanylate cyclase [Candidatus Polarisedimenticolia bacterium]